MNKQTSQSLKGIAILFMLFLHLFNQEYNVTLTDPFLYIGNKPLVSLLAMFTNLCVPIYLFLSGYGLYISYNNTKNASKTPLKRIRVLYENYWSVLLLFVCIGYFVSPEKYPGNIQKVIENTIGWHTSYNGEWWFFFLM